MFGNAADLLQQRREADERSDNIDSTFGSWFTHFAFVSGKGQVVFPAEIRKAAGIESGARLGFSIEGKSMRFEVVRRIAPTRLEDGYGLLTCRKPGKRDLAEFGPARIFVCRHRMESLKGDRMGQWSMRINDRRRLCFRFSKGDAFDVAIVDYHWEIAMAESGLPAIHPGRYLREILDGLRFSQSEVRTLDRCRSDADLARVHGARPMTAELALLIGRAFDQSPHYWLNLQAAYDLKVAREALGTRIEQVEALLD